MARIEFKVGDVFPGDDPVARWVAGLIIISNDLARAHRRLYEIHQLEDEEAKQHSPYWVMLGVSHLREAVKFLHPDTCALLETPQVEAFIGDLPHDAKALLDEIVGEIQPWNESWLFRFGKPLRDRLFHYAGEGPDGTDYTEEIGAALDAMKDFERGIEFEGRNIDWHWMLGEEIRINWIAQGGEVAKTDYAELVDDSVELAGRIVKFAGHAITAHLEERVKMN